MQEMMWNDGLLPGRRRPQLWLVNENDEARKFEGASIDGFCLILTSFFKKNGIWGNTTYKLALFPGVRAVELCPPLHNNWGDKYESWIAAANDMGVSLDVAKKIVTEEYPSAAERFDRIDAIMEAIKHKETTFIKIINVTRKDEYIKVQTPCGPVILKPGIGPGNFVSWSTPSIEGDGVKIMDVKESGHGRHTVYTIRLAMMAKI